MAGRHTYAEDLDVQYKLYTTIRPEMTSEVL